MVSDIIKGKFIPIHDLVRQPQATNPHNNTDIKLAANVTISTSARPKRREVESPDDWVETYLSSVLPALAHKADRAASLTEAKTAVKQLQQHITYALSAVVMFRRSSFPFASCLRYLESHREECANRPLTDIGAPDLTKLTTLTQESVAEAARTAAAAAAHTTHVTARGHTAHTPQKQSAAAATGICGSHNSYKGCAKPAGTCVHQHICLQCRAPDHIKPNCPQFTPKSTHHLQQPPKTTAAPATGVTPRK